MGFHKYASSFFSLFKWINVSVSLHGDREGMTCCLESNLCNDERRHDVDFFCLQKGRFIQPHLFICDVAPFPPQPNIKKLLFFSFFLCHFHSGFFYERTDGMLTIHFLWLYTFTRLHSRGKYYVCSSTEFIWVYLPKCIWPTLNILDTTAAVLHWYSSVTVTPAWLNRRAGLSRQLIHFKYARTVSVWPLTRLSE